MPDLPVCSLRQRQELVPKELPGGLLCACVCGTHRGFYNAAQHAQIAQLQRPHRSSRLGAEIKKEKGFFLLRC
jgi:hypothetical protein